jgi:enoyl-CoA hydratase
MRVDRKGSVETWTLDRPQAHNALDAATFAELARALDGAAADAASGADLRAVILAAEGPTFAAGGDLRELRGATGADDAARLLEAGRRVCDGIASLPVPVLAAIDGPAIGGGAELAMACDLRVASRRASLCFKHAAMGVTTAWGILPRLTAIAGPSVAARLLFTAQTIDADEALRLGLFDCVTGDGDAAACLLTAEKWAADVARGAPRAVAGMKALLRRATAHDGARSLERDLFVENWTSADHSEAVEAFFARRPPRWSGR